MDFQTWQCIVCVTYLFPFDVLNMVAAEFQEEIRAATASIMECVKDPEWAVREAAITGLSNIAACRMLPFGTDCCSQPWL